MNIKDNIFIICDCYSCGIQIFFEKEDNQFYLSTWFRGRYSHILGWKERFRWIWRVLRTGDPWADEIILNTENAHKLSIFLSDTLYKNNLNKTRNEKERNCNCK